MQLFLRFCYSPRRFFGRDSRGANLLDALWQLYISNAGNTAERKSTHCARRPRRSRPGERETHRGQSWQLHHAAQPVWTHNVRPKMGPPQSGLLCGERRNKLRILSFRACAEAQDTQFVSTQDRLPWLGLKAVETPSTSCESCQALSALFPIAGARAANTAEIISKEWSVYVRKQKILLHEAQGKFLHQ